MVRSNNIILFFASLKIKLVSVNHIGPTLIIFISKRSLLTYGDKFFTWISSQTKILGHEIFPSSYAYPTVDDVAFCGLEKVE